MSKAGIQVKIEQCYKALATYGGDGRLRKFYTNCLRHFQKQLERNEVNNG